jgi:Transcriptional activator of glycolytic enzymes
VLVANCYLVCAQRFKDRMEVALRNEDCPLDAKLESVLPGVHAWHKDNQTELKDVGRKINAIDEKLEMINENLARGLDCIDEHAQQRQVQSNRRIAASFLDIAQHFLSGNDGSARTVNDLMPQLGESNGDADYDDDPMHVSLTEDDALDLTNEDRATQQSSSALDKVYQFAPKIHTLSDLYDEWNGTGNWQGDPHGGIIGRNREHKSKWRKNLPSRAKQHYSRMARSIAAVQFFAKQNRCSEKEAVAILEDMYTIDSAGSLSVFVTKCQEKKYIKKATSRRKNGKSNIEN